MSILSFMAYNSCMKRVIFDAVMILAVFLLPWWIPVILALVGIFLFVQFYEFLGVGIVMYALYAIPSTRFISSPVWFPFIISVIYIAIQFSKRYIILYKNEI